MRDFCDAKAMAGTLRSALAARGLKMTISESLELIADMFGEVDWNTLAAAIRAERTAQQNKASPIGPPTGAKAAWVSGAQRPLSSRNRPMFSRAFESALDRAMAHANQRKHEYVTLEHLLLALTNDEDALAVMKGCKVDLDKLCTSLVNFLDTEFENLVTDSDDASPTPGFQRVIQRAVIDIQSIGRKEITGADVLVAMFAERESHAAYFMMEQGMDRYDAVSYISHGFVKGSGNAPARRNRDRRSPG